MIPVCWDEISSRPAGTNLTIRLHEEIKFCRSKAGEFSTWHFLRFVCNFFPFFFVIMWVYEIENPYISTDLQFFVWVISILVYKIRSSRSQILASLRSDVENSDVLLILVLSMHEVIPTEILTSSSEVPNVKIFCFTFSQNLSKRPTNGGSM